MNILIKASYISLLTSLCVASLPVISEELPARGPIPFASYDRDANGFISEDEFMQVRSERMAAKGAQGRPMKGAGNAPSFAAFDTNSDGQLTQEELTAGQQAQREKRRGMRGQGPGMGQGQGKGAGMGRGKGAGMSKGRNMPSFAEYDLDGDGSILEQEFYDARAERIRSRAEQGYPMRNIVNAPSFEDIDTNSDAKIDAQEFAEHQVQHRQQMMKRK